MDCKVWDTGFIAVSEKSLAPDAVVVLGDAAEHAQQWVMVAVHVAATSVCGGGGPAWGRAGCAGAVCGRDTGAWR